jgi:hypothetical protein
LRSFVTKKKSKQKTLRLTFVRASNDNDQNIEINYEIFDEKYEWNISYGYNIISWKENVCDWQVYDVFVGCQGTLKCCLWFITWCDNNRGARIQYTKFCTRNCFAMLHPRHALDPYLISNRFDTRFLHKSSERTFLLTVLSSLVR